MATHNRQSQFYRSLSFWFSSLTLLVTSLVGFSARAADIDPSGYKLFNGDRFFLLTDATFGSGETAKVRLEAPGQEERLKGYGGVDIVVYRVPDALAFLRMQKNLHRPEIKGRYEGEGLGNVLNYLWDSWYKKSRLAWQRLFSSPARERAVAQAPELKQVPPHTYQTSFENDPQFKLLTGMTLVDRFRYPLWEAKPIAPPKGVLLEGSSTNFIEPRAGNVYIPLGKQKPGLYVVEAYVGNFRATTLVFVSDTVAITKLSGGQTLVWTVDKQTGLPSPGCKISLTDGVGTLKSGVTGADGVWLTPTKPVDRTYVLGKDQTGGVFVSENFYYDSEIYDAKIYVFTDRPLYHPGDTVYVKALGRQFKSSASSVGLEAGTAELKVIDSTGNTVVRRELKLGAVNGSLDGGADTSFSLPQKAPAGGYTLKLVYSQSSSGREANYAASFRVNEFIKPHFEIDVRLEKSNFKTNEPIRGMIKLTYPSGKPVTNAKVTLEARAQKMTMVGGQIEYLGNFPVQLLKHKEEVSEDGTVAFELPAAKDPSRYILKLGGVDSASFRVSTTREILIQAGHALFDLKTERRFTRPSDEVTFTFASADPTQSSGVSPEALAVRAAPATWEAVRLEDRSTFTGIIQSGQAKFTLRFDQPGSYTVGLKDAAGAILGSTAHWVEGADLKSVPGSIEMIADKDEYKTGDVANILITFSEKVTDGLATLERDTVEQYGRLAKGAAWFQLERKSDRQWVARIPIRGSFAPNVTFSIAYVLNGNFVFQNKGLKVVVPKVQIALTPEKTTYHPGERVVVNVNTRIDDRAVPATLAIGVVDEMIYVLQPEIAPEISEFFYHRRRDQVRTTASLLFHTFDVATSALGQATSPAVRYDERALKLRERPRRDETDTALWIPRLTTDRDGKAQFSFSMPDSLTRWRITARAMTDSGVVGQTKSFLESTKDFYLKWIGPRTFREGDRPQVSLVAFNTKSAPENVIFNSQGLGPAMETTLTLNPGSNYLTVPLKPGASGVLTASLRGASSSSAANGSAADLDELVTKVEVVPAGWSASHVVPFPFELPETKIQIPEGSQNVRLSLTHNRHDSFLSAVDDLVAYPYGCVEQTSSRLIPLVLALGAIKESGESPLVRSELENRVLNERFRLIQMAGPNATFGWWGDMTGDSAFFTAYAYYADWLATKALDITLPPQHWENLLRVYERNSQVEPALRRAIIIWIASQMGLPTKTLTEGAMNQLEILGDRDRVPMSEGASYIMEGIDEKLDVDMAAVLVKSIADKNQMPMTPVFTRLAAKALERFKAGAAPILAQAISLAVAAKSKAVADTADALMGRLTQDIPTIDRALSLVFIRQALDSGWHPGAIKPPEIELEKQWKREAAFLSRPVWRYEGKIPAEVTVKLQANSPPASYGELLYESFAPEESRIPVSLHRKLYELTSVGGDALEFKARAVWESGNGSESIVLKSASLYVDEITITPPVARMFRYGLAEIPLPSGASVEGTTWGMKIEGLDGQQGYQDMEEARYHPGARSYSVDLRVLDKPVTFRHLVRFSAVGTFVLPPARYFRMYLPSETAYEGGKSNAMVKVEVEK